MKRSLIKLEKQGGRFRKNKCKSHYKRIRKKITYHRLFVYLYMWVVYGTRIDYVFKKHKGGQ